MTSVARWSSCKISLTISLSSAISGLDDFRIIFCGFGVGQNSAERLVDFVGDGGGQFASGREAVDMGKLGHALPGLHFGQLTPAMLIQQER